MQHLFAPAGVQRGHLFERGQGDLVRGRIGEADVVELHRHVSRRDGHGVGLLLDQRLEVQDLKDPLEADQGTHDFHAGVGQGGERGVQAGEQERQHHDVARGELPADGQPAAQAVDERQGERGHQRERRDKGELQHGCPDADVADPARPYGELTGFLVRPAEEFHQRGARRGEPFSHLGAHGSIVFGGLTAQVRQPGTHPAGRNQEDRQQDHRQHGHLPGRAEHHDHGQDQGHHVADHTGQSAGEG